MSGLFGSKMCTALECGSTQQMKCFLTLGTGALTPVDFCRVSFPLKVCPPEDAWDPSPMALQGGWLLLGVESSFFLEVISMILYLIPVWICALNLIIETGITEIQTSKIHSSFPWEYSDAKQRVKPILCVKPCTAFMEQHCLNSVWLDCSSGVF